jgi:hypothetical protein
MKSSRCAGTNQHGTGCNNKVIPLCPEHEWQRKPRKKNCWKRLDNNKRVMLAGSVASIVSVLYIVPYGRINRQPARTANHQAIAGSPPNKADIRRNGYSAPHLSRNHPV